MFPVLILHGPGADGADTDGLFARGRFRFDLAIGVSPIAAIVLPSTESNTIVPVSIGLSWNVTLPVTGYTESLPEPKHPGNKGSKATTPKMNSFMRMETYSCGQFGIESYRQERKSQEGRSSQRQCGLRYFDHLSAVASSEWNASANRGSERPGKFKTIFQSQSENQRCAT